MMWQAAAVVIGGIVLSLAASATLHWAGHESLALLPIFVCFLALLILLKMAGEGMSR